MKLAAAGLALIADSERESRLLDLHFGSKVGENGLIATATAECRLADGYGEHYVLLKIVQQPVRSEDDAQHAVGEPDCDGGALDAE